MGRGLRRAFILLLVQFILALAGCSEGVSTTQNLNLIPIQKPPRISAGKFHTCAVASDGTLWCWGHLKATENYDKNVPLKMGEDSDWVGVSAGFLHTCGIKKDGSLWCWGYNKYGQLGIGSMENKFYPAKVRTGGWAFVSAGYWHTCGIKTDGTLWCWGDNYYGQLGDGTKESASIPVQVGKDSDWAVVYAGESSTCGIKRDGTLWCWSVGDETSDYEGVENLLFVRVNHFIKFKKSDWVDFANGSAHSCGITKDGTLWCFGNDNYGQVGDGPDERMDDDIMKLTWIPIGEPSEWVSVSAKYKHTCGIKKDGSLWCWGDNKSGQVGNDTESIIDAPVKVGEGDDWAYVSAGWYHTCGMKKDGSIFCWGDNSHGQLGDGKGGYINVPQQIDDPSQWLTVSASDDRTCAVKTDGTLWCWGSISYYWRWDMGSPDLTIADPESFQRILQMVNSDDWLSVSTGKDHLCALKTNGTLWCSNPDQGLTQVGSDSDWVDVSAGADHTCAIKSNGTLWCWGKNYYGQLGDGTYEAKDTPSQVGSASDWVNVSAGVTYTCGIKADGTLWCWGRNNFGQLGDGTKGDKNIPVQVGNDADWSFVSTGENHTCAVKRDGTLWCWGSNWYGQLGIGSRLDMKLIPVQVGNSTDWEVVAVGFSHTCALKKDNTLWCWGNNEYGELGDGTYENKNVPVQVRKDADWADLVAGKNYTCALKQNGTLWCWGSNEYFQLGYYPRSATPVKVLLE